MQPPEMTNDQIRKELSAIAIELTERAADDFASRIELRERQRELRGEVALRPLNANDITSMRREITGLQRRFTEILDERPNIAAMNDGGEGQRGMAENQQFGWDYDEGTGRTAIHERIVYLERRIAEAEGS